MPRKKAEVTKVEKPQLYPPKPLEKLIKGQILYCWHPTNGWSKRIYEKDYKGEGEVLCRDENGKGWILNLEHLHTTILTKEEYEKLGQVDK